MSKEIKPGPLSGTIFDIFHLSENQNVEFGKAIFSGVLAVTALVALAGMETAFEHSILERVDFIEPCFNVLLIVVTIGMLGSVFMHGLVAGK